MNQDYEDYNFKFRDGVLKCIYHNETACPKCLWLSEQQALLVRPNAITVRSRVSY